MATERLAPEFHSRGRFQQLLKAVQPLSPDDHTSPARILNSLCIDVTSLRLSLSVYAHPAFMV
ncbi:MAG: hypothetical protein ACYC4R_04600 [Anaerolineae bacterium]